MSERAWLLLCAGWVALAGCTTPGDPVPWRAELQNRLIRLGERNWIVIAEASFPAHSRRGVAQTTSPLEIPATLDEVLRSLETTEHVRPRIFTARELRYVDNDSAPGIDQLREQLRHSMHGHVATEIDHQSLITLLEDAGQTFDVLVIRTPTALPYSSVFIELQHGYWDADAEGRLREKMTPPPVQGATPPADA